MRHGFAFWVICLSLVFTRLVGLHLHACAGVEAGVEHAGTHYADNGFFFGDHHSEDDSDDREVEFVSVPSSIVKVAFSDVAAPLPAPPAVIPVAKVLLTMASPRGPPQRIAAHPPHFTPPLCGPPISLA